MRTFLKERHTHNMGEKFLYSENETEPRESHKNMYQLWFKHTTFIIHYSPQWGWWKVENGCKSGWRHSSREKEEKVSRNWNVVHLKCCWMSEKATKNPSPLWGWFMRREWGQNEIISLFGIILKYCLTFSLSLSLFSSFIWSCMEMRGVFTGKLLYL